MSIQVPVAVSGTAIGWQLVQQRTVTAAAAESSGRCVLELTQLDGDEMWLIDRATILCTSPLPTRCALYRSAAIDEAFLDGSVIGNRDVAEWATPLVLQPSEHLLATWDNVYTGSTAKITLQYRELRRR